MSRRKRVAFSTAIGIVAVAVWMGGPAFAAAGLALDHPAWAHPDSSCCVGEVDTTTSWFPPGTRYEWTSTDTGERRTALDPWQGDAAGPYVWTGLWLVVVAGGMWMINARQVRQWRRRRLRS